MVLFADGVDLRLGPEAEAGSREPGIPWHLAHGTRFTKWYDEFMDGTHTLTVGDRGRIVVPADVRDRAGLEQGTTLVLLETGAGLVLLTRDQLRDRVRAELGGLDLVAELLADRRSAAADEDAS